MKANKTDLQGLNLKIGERAKCIAGFPHKSTLIVECIKDFNLNYDSKKESYNDFMKRSDDVVNNPYNYVKIVDKDQFGALTSHWISSNWNKL